MSGISSSLIMGSAAKVGALAVMNALCSGIWMLGDPYGELNFPMGCCGITKSAKAQYNCQKDPLVQYSL